MKTVGDSIDLDEFRERITERKAIGAREECPASMGGELPGLFRSSYGTRYNPDVPMIAPSLRAGRIRAESRRP